MGQVEFWYEFGSTYSYPAAMRIERLAADAGVEVRWRPFLLGPIFKAYGWNDLPFNIFAAKGRYMWRDLARICAADGLPLKLPPVSFPQNGLKAARLALVGEQKAGRPPLPAPCSPPITPSRRTSPTTPRLRAILDGLGVDARCRACRRQHARKQGRAEAPDRGSGSARPVRRAVLHCSR